LAENGSRSCLCTGFRRLDDEIVQHFSPVIDLSR
jgi:hypothetical protein